MPAQAFFWKRFIVITLLLLLLLFISIIGLFRLKRWGKNTFVVITIIMNLSIILLLSKLNIFAVINVFLIIFVFSFLFYFLKPSTLKLFDKKKNRE
jgi:hypothetical protein